MILAVIAHPLARRRYAVAETSLRHYGELAPFLPLTVWQAFWITLHEEACV